MDSFGSPICAAFAMFAVTELGPLFRNYLVQYGIYDRKVGTATAMSSGFPSHSLHKLCYPQ
jgi:hypothetical protein